MIDKSISGKHSAFLNPLGYLVILRADASSVAFIQGKPMIDDLCLVLGYLKEEIPDGYVKVETRAASTARASGERSGNGGGMSSVINSGMNTLEKLTNSPTSQVFSSQGVEMVLLAYHQRPAMGLCDLQYESATLDRYPAKDPHKGLALPAQELPLFAFPHDLRLEYSNLNRFPLPVFFTFVFTDAFGGHLYAACLRFYEKITQSDLETVFTEVYGTNNTLQILPGTGIFCPKVICVVSSMPFYRFVFFYFSFNYFY